MKDYAEQKPWSMPKPMQKKDKTANSLRRSQWPALINAARALHEVVNVLLGYCTHDKISVFEEFLELQIIAFSV